MFVFPLKATNCDMNPPQRGVVRLPIPRQTAMLPSESARPWRQGAQPTNRARKSRSHFVIRRSTSAVYGLRDRSASTIAASWYQAPPQPTISPANICALCFGSSLPPAPPRARAPGGGNAMIWALRRHFCVVMSPFSPIFPSGRPPDRSFSTIFPVLHAHTRGENVDAFILFLVRS